MYFDIYFNIFDIEGFTSILKHPNIEETFNIYVVSSISDCFDVKISLISTFKTNTDLEVVCFDNEGASILILAGQARVGQRTAIAGCSSLLWYRVLIAVRSFTPRGSCLAPAQARGGGGFKVNRPRAGEPAVVVAVLIQVHRKTATTVFFISYRTVCLHSPAEQHPLRILVIGCRGTQVKIFCSPGTTPAASKSFPRRNPATSSKGNA